MKKPGQICIERTFSLMNLFTSKVKSAVLEEQMIHLFRLDVYLIDKIDVIMIFLLE